MELSAPRLSLTEIIAVIGCITGCASLIISFYRAKYESGRLYVRTSKYFNNYFKRLPASNNNTEYQAIIWIEIVNNAPHPTTIYDIDIHLRDGHYCPNSCPVSKIELKQKNGQVIISTFEDMSNHLLTPLTIEPFNVYQGYIFLGFFLDEPKHIEHFFMKVRATQKDRYLIGKIKKWENQAKH